MADAGEAVDAEEGAEAVARIIRTTASDKFWIGVEQMIQLPVLRRSLFVHLQAPQRSSHLSKLPLW